MNFRLTAVLVAVLVTLGGIVWFSEFRDKGAATATPADKQRAEIFKFDDKETKRLEVSTSDQKIDVQKDEGGEWVLQPSGLPADRLRLTSVLFRLGSLQATRRVADQATNLAEYGLQDPVLATIVTQNDGSTYILQIGSKAPTESATYAKRGTDFAVFLIASQLVTDLERLVTEPPIQQPTPTPAPIPTLTPTPEVTPTPSPTPGT